MSSKKAKRLARKEVRKETLEIKDENKDRNRLIVAALLIFTFLVYSSSLGNGFIYFDDPELVMDNYFIRQLTLDNIIHYFTTPVQMTYLPIGLISYAIDYQIGQLDPYIYHLDSLIIHLINILLVYWIFQLLTRKFSVSI